jgi:competence protein ComEC
MQLYIADGDVTLVRGDRIRFITRITIPHRLGLPGEFDFPRYLAFQGIAVTGRVATQDEIVLIRSSAKDSFLRRADLLARHLGDFIRTSAPDADVSAVLTALLLGDQKRIPADLADAYTRSGVNHILSVSGFHVGIIAYFIIMLALLIVTRSEILALRFNLRRFVLLLTVPVMLIYLLLTGSAPATARSVIMLTVFVMALCAERETEPINALLLSAFMLVAIHPPTLFDVSFQLSFLALWGIIVIVPLFMDRFDSVKSNWLRTLIQFVLVSCAATFATIVPVLYIFNQASLNGILTNFLIVPLLGYGAVLTGFCAMPFVYLYKPIAHLLLWIAGKLVALSNWLIGLFAALPVVHFYGISSLDLLLFVLGMCVLTFLTSRKIKIYIFGALPCIAVLIHICSPSKADGRLHVTMLSVGQAESLLLRLPDGTNVLVDGGGYLHENGRDFGERTLVPALFKLGVRRIDHLILTHSHPDHIGGLNFVVRRIPIGQFWESAAGGSGKEYELLKATIYSKQIPVRQLSTDESIALSAGVNLRVLSPHTNTAASDDMGMNEDSLVFRLAYRSFSMLFMADAGFPAEERIMAGGGNLKSAVLKVGHHGSHYSSSEAFLKQVAPSVALISAGKGNSFGLPSSRTLARLSQQGIKVFRTDQDGTIELVSDGTTWDISTPFRPN